MSRDAKKGHTILPLASPGPSAYDEISLDPTPRSQGRLLSPGQPGSPAKPESPFVSPTKRGRKMLQERGDRELYDGKNGKNYTIESHLEEHFKPRTLLAVTIALAFANGADAVEILAAGLFMSKFTDANGEGLSTSGKELLTSSIFTGMLLGGLVGGWLSDRYGRKPMLVCTLIINAAGGLLSAASPSLAWLLFFRVIAGIGVGATIPTVFSLGAELFPTTSRGRYLSVIASAWCVGAIYEASMAWMLLGNDIEGNRISPGTTWRSFVLATAIPVLFTVVITIIFVPRSPRWLVSQGRYDEASRVLYSLTDVTVPPQTLRTKYPQRPTGDGLSDACGRLASLFQGEQRETTLRLVVLWAAVCYSSYGIGSWIINIFEDIHVKNEFAARFLFALANVPGNVASFLLIDVVGRRRLLASSLLLASFFGFIFTACTSQSSKALAVFAACAFNACSAASWNALDALSSESFPLPVRVTSMGMLGAVGRLSSIAAQFINGSLEHNSLIALVFFITGAAMVVGALCAMTLPREPLGVALDQVSSPPTSAAASTTADGKAAGGAADLEGNYSTAVKEQQQQQQQQGATRPALGGR